MRSMQSLIGGQTLRSGLWFKDGRSFINVNEAREADRLAGVRIYEFDGAHRLQQLSEAARAEYRGNGRWRLFDVAQTSFAAEGPATQRLAEADWQTAVNPDLINVLIVVPERMSAWKLFKYTEHLAGNRQKTGRYEIALWKKLFYPLAALVMMALALPFAYMHARSGMVGVKVFLGILLGIFFHMINSLFSHSARAELAVVRGRRPAEHGVPAGGGDDDGPSRGAPTSTRRVPASRSCSNWRSRSNSAHSSEIPVGTSAKASIKRSSALGGDTRSRRMRQAFIARVWPPRSQHQRK
jgi:hypothetical protein